MKNEQRLLKLLKEENQVVSAMNLAKRMNVSSRTIRNYVKKINELFPENVVHSTSKGYCLNNKNYTEAVFYYEEIIPKDTEERVNCLISILLKSAGVIPFCELLDELNVSETTLATDLRKATVFFLNHQLILKRQKNGIFLLGSEQQKRKLIRKIFSEETQDQMLNFYSSQDILTDEEVAKLRNIVVTKLQEKEVDMNEFALSNVLLHLVVAIMRLKTNQYITELLHQNQYQETKEYQLAKEIFFEISARNNIQVSEEEIEALRMLLVGNTIERQVNGIIANEIMELVRMLIEQVNKLYFMDLRDDEFIMRFSIHLSNLIERRKKGIINENPMLPKLKQQHPLIYDLGLFVANLIKEQTGFDISENEVAYLALHIGIYLNEEIERDSVTVTVVAPAYNQMEKKIIENIDTYFADQIKIKKTITSYIETTKPITTELVLSTIPFLKDEQFEVVVLTPLFNQSDIKNIEKAVNKIRIKKQIQTYQQMAEEFFDERHFYHDIYKKNKDEYMDFLGTQLISSGTITETYYHSIIEREEMSSTAFDTVAIPHSLFRNAKRSLFAVLYNQNAIYWNNQSVELVLMMIVGPDNQDRFNDFLQLLIRVFSEQEVTKKIVQQTTYADFIQVLSEAIKNQLESE